MNTVGIAGKLGRAVATAAIVAVAGSPGGSAWAQAQGGNINSIVVQAFDAQTGLPIDLHSASTGLYNGARVRLIATAYDAMGNSLPCTPRFTERSGVAGNQLNFGQPAAADNSVMMTAGQGFGSTEIIPSCAEFPNFTGTPVNTAVMAPGTNLGTAQAGLGLRRTPAATGGKAGGTPGASTGTAASTPAQSGGKGGVIAGVIVGGALAVGAVAYGLSTATEEEDSGSSCATYSQCCPGGNNSGGCFVPSSCGCPSPAVSTGICGSGCPGPQGDRVCDC